MVNKTPMKVSKAYMKATSGNPSASTSVKNVSTTNILKTQLTSDDNDTAGPLAHVGYISEFIIQESVTSPDDVDATSKIITTSENIAYLLSGQ